MELIENSFELISNLHHTNPNFPQLNHLNNENRKLKNIVWVLGIGLVIVGVMIAIERRDQFPDYSDDSR